jgi:hypothetical protein
MVHRLKIGLALLVGMVPYALAQAPSSAGSEAATAMAPGAETGSPAYTVPAGTKILLSLKSEISTRNAAPGDSVYLVSDFPVVEAGSVMLPAGMYVKGIVDSVQRAGKVKGRAQIQLHFVSMILPNGTEVPLPGSLDKVPGAKDSKVKNAEGTVEQAGSKGKDTQRIASDTLEGAGVGGLIGYGTGNVGMGAGIGAGAGAAVGILTTLFTRGNDVVIPQGTTLEMVLSRPVVLKQAQLAGMPASTGMTVPASTAAQQPTAVRTPPYN